MQAVITSVAESADTDGPSPGELEEFYQRERDRFARPGRLCVERFYFLGRAAEGAARERAVRARQRLGAGEAASVVRAELADEPVFELPAALLPAAKIRDYIGSSALRAVRSLEPGGLTEPLETEAGSELFRLLEREPATLSPLAEVRERVRSEWIRQQADRALRSYIEALKSDA